MSVSVYKNITRIKALFNISALFIAYGIVITGIPIHSIKLETMNNIKKLAFHSIAYLVQSRKGSFINIIRRIKIINDE
tara:strand:+ start:234 stop:467 length:234 start_codon:yes stop_codon:yes gene_type:complete